jgi:hypothetical protein
MITVLQPTYAAECYARSQKATISFMSVRPSAWNNSAPTGRIFIKFDILAFFEYLSRKFKFH